MQEQMLNYSTKNNSDYDSNFLEIFICDENNLDNAFYSAKLIKNEEQYTAIKHLN